MSTTDTPSNTVPSGQVEMSPAKILEIVAALSEVFPAGSVTAHGWGPMTGICYADPDKPGMFTYFDTSWVGDEYNDGHLTVYRNDQRGADVSVYDTASTDHPRGDDDAATIARWIESVITADATDGWPGFAKAAARADSVTPPTPGPDWAKIAQSTVGTADSEAAIADRHDVNVDDVVERLLDFNVETCPGCGWWVESHELADNDTCDDCRN